MVGAHALTETLSITVVNTGGTPRSMVTQGDAVIRARRHQLVEYGYYSEGRVLRWESVQREQLIYSLLYSQGGIKRLMGGWSHRGALEDGYRTLELSIHFGDHVS